MIIEEYKKIDTPEKLMKFMDKYINYGFHGTDGVNYTNDGSEEKNKLFQEACEKVYVELSARHYGVYEV